MKNISIKVLSTENYQYGSSTNKVIADYQLECSDMEEFNNLYQEAREVWDNCMVEAYWDGISKRSNVTYRESVLADYEMEWTRVWG
jgi:hypothetical protein